jgi:aldose sugar dehydrogenase
MTSRLTAAAAALALLLTGVASAQEFQTEHGRVEAVTLAKGLERPWGLAFLPDGRMLITERSGSLRVVGTDSSVSQPLAGVPEVAARGQGGLLDVALDPGFGQNRLVYVAYAEPGSGGTAGTAVARGRLGQNGLDQLQVIFRQEPKVRGGNHFGSRLVFARDGSLFVTLGDRYDYSDSAQDLSTHIGKVVRILPDGGIPRDNPFASRAGIKPEIWSYGHRNIQAAALHPQTGQLWTVEHGARGGDEINIPEAGKNYGWPVISYGVHYSGARIGEGTHKPGMEQPVFYWDPSIAPSGALFYTGDRFPAWRGNLLTGSLKFSRLVRLELSGTRVSKQEQMLDGYGQRIRDVRQGPDGLIYLLTDHSDGRLVRLQPAAGRS